MNYSRKKRHIMKMIYTWKKKQTLKIFSFTFFLIIIYSIKVKEHLEIGTNKGHVTNMTLTLIFYL